MKSYCTEPTHSKRPIILICTSSTCNKSPLLCAKCLVSHSECLESLKDVQEELVLDLEVPVKEQKTKKPKKSLYSLEDLEEMTDKQELLQAYEELVNHEFKKISKYFSKKIEETKQSILYKARSLYNDTRYDLESFKRRIKKLFNFTSLPELADSLHVSEMCFQTMKKDFGGFINELDIEGTKKKEFHANPELFENFEHEIPENNLEDIEKTKKIFGRFQQEELLPERVWTWNPHKKSSLIYLWDFNCLATKKVGHPNYDSAVIGTMEFYGGCYEWEIEVFDQWVCVGIIESHLIHPLEGFPYKRGIGFDTGKRFYQMEKVQLFNDYKNKVYHFSLNLEKGTFVISCRGKVIAKQQQSLRGKRFVPFVDIYNAGGRVRLISSSNSSNSM